ncbi:MAG: Hpt domain-containing protein [Deltaproteobacteria bacterium]|nr:Hpt domain-containing protein [Deltaproteobacteria bacterium]
MTVEVDKAAICENFMDDEELIFESIDLFMESSNARLKILQEAVAQRDPDRVMAEAHALKGVVGIFSPGEIMEAAKILEFMGRNKNLEGVDEALVNFENLLGQLTEILRQWKEEGISDGDDDDDE